MHQVAAPAAVNAADTDGLFRRLEELNSIGVSLSKEKDITRLLEKILIAAKTITNADGGTLYRINDEGNCQFEIMRTDSLNIAMGGTTGVAIPFYPIHLIGREGLPNNSMVVAYSVLHDSTVNIPDAYVAEGFDFSGTKNFDKKTGYRSKSFLTVPMKNHENEIIGVLQLINAQDRKTGEIIPFSAADQGLAESLASQAAIALTTRLLINQLEELFEAFINLINTAIDDKSPYTGGHCQRVPVLTMMLAEAAIRTRTGPLREFSLDEHSLYELKLAGLLHDCGKVTTPVHIVDKATKLQTIFDRIDLIDTRFEVAKREAEVEMLKAKLKLLENNPRADTGGLEAEYAQRIAAFDDDRNFLRRANIGGEFMSVADIERVQRIARMEWVNEQGEQAPLLSADEVYNLSITRGTLTREDRQIINNHVAMTYKMLSALPWPKHLRGVPEIAASHHERLDGKGYHRGLTAEKMPLQARIVAIADIFEALTAKDRPYKPGKTLSESLEILGRMALENHVDSHLFDVFIREKVYMKYAEQFLDPVQINQVDETQIPGYTP
jgi:HD-GYP domain-containing protein (c-di-GMP phosphodiesterase class II)